MLGNVTYSHTKVKQWTSMVRARTPPPDACCNAPRCLRCHQTDDTAYFLRAISLQCIENCIKKLKDLNKPFKYIGARARAAPLCTTAPATALAPPESHRWLRPPARSDGGDHAEKRSGLAHGHIMLLGQHLRRCVRARLLSHARSSSWVVPTLTLLSRLVAAGSATLRWENKSMYCIVTVFGLSV